MIKAEMHLDEFLGFYSLSVQGHANTAPHGQDLVCAEASILAMTLAKTLLEKGMAEYEDIKLDPGDVFIRAWGGSDVKAIFDVIAVGFQLLADNEDCIRLLTTH